MMFRDPHAFADRREAGRVLSAALTQYAGRDDTLVLALPRGGVPVAFEVATALDAPLDVFLVRKLGTPGRAELAMGAIASGGIQVLNEDVIKWLGISPEQIEAVAEREREELARRDAAYRQGGPLPSLAGRIVILVDDGLATGSTMRAAVQAVKQQSPARVIVAVPVGAAETCQELRAVADEVICSRTPFPFSAVGQWYVDFDQTSDAEVSEILRERSAMAGPHA
jgi:putative phosphoribosyl transferase